LPVPITPGLHCLGLQLVNDTDTIFLSFAVLASYIVTVPELPLLPGSTVKYMASPLFAATSPWSATSGSADRYSFVPVTFFVACPVNLSKLNANTSATRTRTRLIIIVFSLEVLDSCFFFFAILTASFFYYKVIILIGNLIFKGF
jgi:hypothetical protein